MTAPLKESPSQTAGPYVHIGCVPNHAGVTGVYPQDPGRSPFPSEHVGEPIKLEGCIYDGEGAPVCDALIESWQAGPDGKFGPGAQGWGRVASDAKTGLWQIETLRPSAAAGEGAFVALWIVARGINLGLHTRAYLGDKDNKHCPVLQSIAEPRLRETLIAKPLGGGRFRFDIHLQGEQETVFFDV